ncbi:DNA replication initiation control protein YabA [Lactobacillus sp. PV034]|uniref:DNA replication initiation control protein YabA n=1 Tax=Lactobacillus sp. PV034 TaxID=2594495 RepID=UPI002240C402|nr:DNA replication initiation control protein YabA [Lactobacillus sp. PV034]QNQ81436.1 DNA replication initiation control protein YabA [Lactobacillus sp. PV034]
MDPFSQLTQLQQGLDAMTKTVTGLKNDLLDVLKENTELKVENQLLREKISKLDKKENSSSKSQAGLKSLRNIYNSGYHICNMYYGSHRDEGEDCMFCLDILDNFENHAQKPKKD